MESIFNKTSLSFLTYIVLQLPRLYILHWYQGQTLKGILNIKIHQHSFSNYQHLWDNFLGKDEYYWDMLSNCEIMTLNNIGAEILPSAIEEDLATSGPSYYMSILLLIFNWNIVIILSMIQVGMLGCLNTGKNLLKIGPS